MGLRQFLNVIGPLHQRVMVELFIPDLHHVQDDLGVLRIVLIPAVVQGFACSRQRDGRDQLNLKTSRAKMKRQSSVIVASRLECDPHGAVISGVRRQVL